MAALDVISKMESLLASFTKMAVKEEVEEVVEEVEEVVEEVEEVEEVVEEVQVKENEHIIDSMEKIKEFLQSLPKENALEYYMSLIPVIHKKGTEYGFKLFDNYNYRTVIMYDQVKKIWDDLTLSKKRTGVDSSSKKYSLADIEFKTGNDDKMSNPLKTSFMWDKQTEELRRTKTLNSDAYVLGRFESEVLQCILVGHEKHTIEHISTIMKTKQKDIVEHWNKNIENGKRGGSDAIRINYEELLQSENLKWDLWFNNEWYKSIDSKECKTMINSLKKDKPKKSS